MELAKLNDHVAFAAYQVGNLEMALEASLMVVELDSANYRVQDNIEWYEYELEARAEREEKAEIEDEDDSDGVSGTEAAASDGVEDDHIGERDRHGDGSDSLSRRQQTNFSADNILAHSDEAMESQLYHLPLN